MNVALVNAKEHGWEVLRLRVFSRDGGCIAVQKDIAGKNVAPDPCRDKHGRVVGFSDRGALTLDHVKEQPAIGTLQIKKREDRHSYKAPDDEAHLVTVCWGHHIGAWSWATSNRDVERKWLRQQYPDVWGADV